VKGRIQEQKVAPKCGNIPSDYMASQPKMDINIEDIKLLSYINIIF
jgi:hypothetical protein